VAIKQTAVLGLPDGEKLCYRLDFDNMIFNGDDQGPASFGRDVAHLGFDNDESRELIMTCANLVPGVVRCR
jgi:hypothetical protein